MPTDNEPMFEKFAQFKIFEKSNLKMVKKRIYWPTKFIQAFLVNAGL